ncbi:tetratricopeptide repeat protein [Methylibium sp. T29]|uniref:tetratricopeptide repeat protein n=1 Tax=Methylibium sp. T29 TaxID=1430884 RepID=UPI0003F3E881|nr:tetratricopeptide repeat protein [Methylibium sp. T29]EWS55208.1 tol-pal system protein YbgF [Methylibium sp. T29]
MLYQLARAQEQGGELEVALKTLDRLVQDYPQTAYRDEAHFRHGELLFTVRDYAKAEQAYGTVLAGDEEGPYQGRALYMQGWSRFKQGRLEEALSPFFGVLDLTLGDLEGDDDLDSLADLSRADRELVEDTFRVASLCLQNLQGAESIPAYITSDVRRGYEFRIYQQLGELYIKQERTKDAADTFGAFARRQPLHAQAPVLQARVIEIYQQAGFANLALEAKKEYVARYGASSEFRRANPQAGNARSRWSRPTWPSWRATITPARRRAGARPITRRRCAGTAAGWSRSRPTPMQRPTTSCWPSCCTRTRATPRP